MTEPVHPISGHHAGWGLAGGSRRRIEPYKLTPGSIDTMCVTVREKIDIHGVGTDVVVMEGVFTVRRDHPCALEGGDPRWGESCVKTEFRSLELYGESPVFGTVRVHLDPDHSSHGEVGPAEDGSLAAACVAHCFPVVELPELGMRLTTNGAPVDLASKVVQIPPVGDVARSGNSAVLVDDFGNAVGEIVSSDIEVGEVLCSMPLGSTRARGDAGHVHTAEHTKHSHPDPSGPGFFADGAAPRGNGGTSGSSGGHDRGAAGHDHGTGGTTVDDGNLAATLERLERELRTLADLIRSRS